MRSRGGSPLFFLIRCRMGDGVEANFTKAIHHYKAAADQGVPEAHANLGLMYLQVSWSCVNLSIRSLTSFSSFSSLSFPSLFPPSVSPTLPNFLFSPPLPSSSQGSGVDQDFKLARQHLHEAGSVGLSHAKFYLGHLLAGSFGGGERNCTQSVSVQISQSRVAITAHPSNLLLPHHRWISLKQWRKQHILSGCSQCRRRSRTLYIRRIEERRASLLCVTTWSSRRWVRE